MDGAVAEILIGAETTTIAVTDGEWFFVLTAFDTYGNESGHSNEVTLITDSIAPGNPGEFKITITISVP